MINSNIVLFSWYTTENEFEYSSLFMIYHRECFTVLFKRSNGWMASHLEKLVLKLMQCGVGREECCSGIKRPCCRLPPKRRQSFLAFIFYTALQWHLESVLQMTLCPKTMGVSLLQVCACNIPPLCILALVQLVVPKKEKLDELWKKDPGIIGETGKFILKQQ